MANKITNTDYYSAIANAIRSKNGETDTYTPAEMADAIGRIPQGGGGGGSSYTLLGSAEFPVNTASTSDTSVGSISCGASAYTSSKIVYVRVRDKAGKRTGYFYGSDVFFINPNKANGSSSTFTSSVKIIIKRISDTKWAIYIGTTSGYGVYAKSITTDGEVSINSRYNSSNSSIINGTFRCEVYALDWPDGISPFYEEE